MSPKTAPEPEPVATSPSMLHEISVQRRPPWGNPAVGTRGTRTQQRILQAALEVFGEVGYHNCWVEQITEVAGCSRPAFYQYFSSKEHLFRQLAGEVARALVGAIEAMGRVTPDEAGWYALRGWLSAHADLYGEYWPVFGAFAAAEGSDDVLAQGASRAGERQMRLLAAKVDPVAFRSTSPEVVARVLLNAVNRSNRYHQLLLRIAPDRAPERARLLDSLADVLHRSLFGRLGVTVAEPRALQAATTRESDERMFEALTAEPSGLGPRGRATRLKVIDAGAEQFRRLGYHDTRVDDIVAVADVSHGTFYRYFENKDEIFRVIAGRSSRRVYTAIANYPDISADPGSTDATRRLNSWLTDYSATWAAEGKLFRIWVEAMGRDPQLVAVTVRVMSAFRAALGRFLADRETGDTEMDAFLLVALLDLSHDGPRKTRNFELSTGAVVDVIRRGFLGLDVTV